MKKIAVKAVLIILVFLISVFILVGQTKDIIVTNSGGEEARYERLAVVVGVGNYLNRKVADLKFTNSDAGKMAKVFEEKGVYDVQLFTDEEGEFPTKSNIMYALNEADYLAENKMIKSFVFYFSGHGFEQDGINYLAPIDVDPSDLKETGINLNEVLGILENIRKNAKVMVFMDACRNDPGGSKSMGSGFTRDDESRGYGVFFSTSPGNYSYELPELGAGLYTHYLLEAMEGAADSAYAGNGDGYVSFSEAVYYVTYKMREWSKENPEYSQLPWVKMENTGEFFITQSGDYVPPVEDDDEDDDKPRPNPEGKTHPDLKDVSYRDMVHIDGGAYIEATEDGSFAHKVSSFEMGKYEVTYELWYTVYFWAVFEGYTFANAGKEGHNGTIGAKPSSSSKYEPVTTVNWRDCIVWCNAYSEMNGLEPVYRNNDGNVIRDSRDSNENECDKAEADWSANGYRLPTEGEWQYAASNKGETPQTHASGASDDYENSSATGKVAWYDGNSGGKTHDVGTKQANELGLYDMSGNVWEWCWDWYGDLPTSARTDYRGSTAGSDRVLRGGSWDFSARGVRVGNRDSNGPDYEFNFLGFRLARRP